MNTKERILEQLKQERESYKREADKFEEGSTGYNNWMEKVNLMRDTITLIESNQKPPKPPTVSRKAKNLVTSYGNLEFNQGSERHDLDPEIVEDAKQKLLDYICHLEQNQKT